MDERTLITYLSDFYSAEEIRAHRKQIGDALLSKAALPIVINQRSREGSSSGGISLATNEECTRFMRACEAAERIKANDTSLPADQLGTGLDFSRRPVLA